MNYSELIELFRDYDFPEEVQIALEKDYSKAGYLYNQETIKSLYAYFRVCPDATGADLQLLARKIWTGAT